MSHHYEEDYAPLQRFSCEPIAIINKQAEGERQQALAENRAHFKVWHLIEMTRDEHGTPEVTAKYYFDCDNDSIKEVMLFYRQDQLDAFIEGLIELRKDWERIYRG